MCKSPEKVQDKGRPLLTQLWLLTLLPSLTARWWVVHLLNDGFFLNLFQRMVPDYLCLWSDLSSSRQFVFMRSGFKSPLSPLLCFITVVLIISQLAFFINLQPVSYPDGPMTARCRFIKNAYWDVIKCYVSKLR